MNAKIKIPKCYDRKDSGNCKVSTKTHSSVFYSFPCIGLLPPRFSLMLYSRSVIVLGFIGLWSILSYFFVKAVRSGSRLIVLHVMSSCSSTICWNDCLCSTVEKTILLHCITFVPLSEINWLYLCGTFWANYFVPVIYSSILSAILHCLDYCSFIGKSWSWVMAVFQLCSPSTLYWLFWVFWLSR